MILKKEFHSLCKSRAQEPQEKTKGALVLRFSKRSQIWTPKAFKNLVDKGFGVTA